MLKVSVELWRLSACVDQALMTRSFSIRPNKPASEAVNMGVQYPTRMSLDPFLGIPPEFAAWPELKSTPALPNPFVGHGFLHQEACHSTKTQTASNHAMYE